MMYGRITNAEFMYSPDYDFGLYMDVQLEDDPQKRGMMFFIQNRMNIKELFRGIKEKDYFNPKTLLGRKVEIKDNNKVFLTE